MTPCHDWPSTSGLQTEFEATVGSRRLGQPRHHTIGHVQRYQLGCHPAMSDFGPDRDRALLVTPPNFAQTADGHPSRGEPRAELLSGLWSGSTGPLDSIGLDSIGLDGRWRATRCLFMQPDCVRRFRRRQGSPPRRRTVEKEHFAVDHDLCPGKRAVNNGGQGAPGDAS